MLAFLHSCPSWETYRCLVDMSQCSYYGLVSVMKAPCNWGNDTGVIMVLPLNDTMAHMVHWQQTETSCGAGFFGVWHVIKSGFLI